MEISNKKIIPKSFIINFTSNAARWCYPKIACTSAICSALNSRNERVKGNMTSSEVFLNTEIRKLRPAERYTLGKILSVSDCWKKLLAVIKNEDANNTPKFTNEHISIIEQAAYQQRQNIAETFLDEWSTMGKERPTLDTLIKYLVKAELYRAADYVAIDILKGEAVKRPEKGPAAVIHISEEITYNNEWESTDLPACLNNITYAKPTTIDRNKE